MRNRKKDKKTTGAVGEYNRVHVEKFSQLSKQFNNPRELRKRSAAVVTSFKDGIPVTTQITGTKSAGSEAPKAITELVLTLRKKQSE